MAYRLIQLLIHFIFLWHNIDSNVLNCTVYPVILQPVPDRIVGTIAVANSSNEEIYFNHVIFDRGVQFPLNFIVVISDPQYPSGTYITQLQIYKLPREAYDLPLWTAESIDYFKQTDVPNSIVFRAYNDYPFIAPCIMGIVLNTQPYIFDLSNNKLMVKVGSMRMITMDIHSYTTVFPILFMITNIPVSEIQNSTSVAVLIQNTGTISAFEAREKTVITSDSECSTMFFRVSQKRWVNLSIIMSAYVLTSVSLIELGAIIRIYDNDYLLFEQSHIIDTLEFPFITPRQLIPITQSKNYTIEATIFGPVAGYTSGQTLFQGVKKMKLIPGTDNTVQISMLYTGPEIGTTIIGTIYQKIPNQNTWPLVGLNLAIAIDNQDINASQSVQFTIYDQTFPIQFTMLNLQKITASYQKIIFTVTITYPNAIVIWDAITAYREIHFGILNRFDVYVARADGYRCQTPGKGHCYSSPTIDVNEACCSQYKCSFGECKSP